MHRRVLEACLVVPRQIPTDLTVKPSALTVMMVAAVGEWYGGEKETWWTSTLSGRPHRKHVWCGPQFCVLQLQSNQNDCSERMLR